MIHEEGQARRDLANVNAGLSTVELRASAEQAAQGNWGDFVRGIAQMSVMGHVLTSGNRIAGVRTGDIFTPEVSRAIHESGRAGNGAALTGERLTQARNQLKAFLGGEVADPAVRTAIDRMTGPEVLTFARERIAAIEAGHAPDPRALADGDLPTRFDRARARLQELGNPALIQTLDRIVSGLTLQRRQAIQEAHLHGEGQNGRYTTAELARKTRILRDAGFTAAEREALMRGGVTGTLADLNPLDVPVAIHPRNGLTPSQVRATALLRVMDANTAARNGRGMFVSGIPPESQRPAWVQAVCERTGMSRQETQLVLRHLDMSGSARDFSVRLEREMRLRRKLFNFANALRSLHAAQN